MRRPICAPTARFLFSALALILFATPLSRAALAQVGSQDAILPQLREEIKPVEASDKDKPAAKEKTSPPETPAPSTSYDSGESVALPLRMASFATGAVLGMPFAIVRRTYTQTKKGARDLAGASSNPLIVVPSVVFSFPFAVMGGPIEGAAYSVINSWKSSGEEPFSKDTFSLGEME